MIQTMCPPTISWIRIFLEMEMTTLIPKCLSWPMSLMISSVMVTLSSYLCWVLFGILMVSIETESRMVRVLTFLILLFQSLAVILLPALVWLFQVIF